MTEGSLRVKGIKKRTASTSPSTFFWAMSDARSRIINSFESFLFKGLIKPVGKPVNWFANQFE